MGMIRRQNRKYGSQTSLRNRWAGRSEYGSVFDGDAGWQSLRVPDGDLFRWDDRSTYVKAPPFFDGVSLQPAPLKDIAGARALNFRIVWPV